MTTMSQDRPLGETITDAATEPFWAAAKEGVLKIRRCTACSKPNWYPRPVCPYCFGDTEWEATQGTGEIYSLTVTRRAGPIPYAMAYVRLDEGAHDAHQHHRLRPRRPEDRATCEGGVQSGAGRQHAADVHSSLMIIRASGRRSVPMHGTASG